MFLCVVPEEPTPTKQSIYPSEKALLAVYADMEKDLDIELILPHLQNYKLLTSAQVESLTLPSKIRSTKLQHLITLLSSKAEHSFLDEFIYCLMESTEGQVRHPHYALAEQLKAMRVEEGEVEIAVPNAGMQFIIP